MGIHQAAAEGAEMVAEWEVEGFPDHQQKGGHLLAPLESPAVYRCRTLPHLLTTYSKHRPQYRVVNLYALACIAVRYCAV